MMRLHTIITLSQQIMSSQQLSSQPFHWHYAEFADSNFAIRGRTLFFIVVLFSIILAVTVLFIYSRWLCRSTPPHHPSSTSPQLTHDDQPPLPPPRGLDLATINSMPIMLYRQSVAGDGNFSEMECCICLGIYGDKEKVKVLPECRHCFHPECVDKWLTAQSSCPICRASLRVDSPV